MLTQTYFKFQGGRTSHFSNRDPISHAASRRRVAGSYSLATLLTLEEFCDSSTEDFLALLSKDAASDKVIDIAEYTDYYTMDTIGEIAFGQNFGKFIILTVLRKVLKFLFRF